MGAAQVVQRCVEQVRKLKTPGGKLVLQYTGKKGKRPLCGDCKTPLSGIACMRPAELKRVSKRQKNVSRAYGGSRCANCVRTRIVRAFLIEERQLVKKVLKAQAASKPAA